MDQINILIKKQNGNFMISISKNISLTLIALIILYQKFAPSRIRENCRFEPTCSNYMIFAINKFGFLKGTILGIKRLIRCRSPYGGQDYP